MKINFRKLIKKIVIAIFMIYVFITLYNQQKTINSYNANIIAVQKDIEIANEHKESLVTLKENAHSLEYIEKIAREKLNMYMPNEKVYKDVK